MRRAVVSILFATVAVVTALACEDQTVTPQRCTNIPPGGCPLSHGVACEDPACEAVYACRPNDVWELERRCPARDGGSGPRSDADASGPALPRDASIDAPPGAFGGPGCVSLQEPDCALGTALACGVTCCGCEDLYVCEDGAWTLWGACADGGIAHGF